MGGIGFHWANVAKREVTYRLYRMLLFVATKSNPKRLVSRRLLCRTGLSRTSEENSRAECLCSKGYDGQRYAQSGGPSRRTALHVLSPFGRSCLLTVGCQYVTLWIIFIFIYMVFFIVANNIIPPAINIPPAYGGQFTDF